LAYRLAQAVRCPAICRDEVKEGLMNAMGEIEESREDLQRNVYDAFFDAIEPLRKHGVTLVAEARFQYDRRRRGSSRCEGSRIFE
jgi:hypothetical protein